MQTDLITPNADHRFDGTYFGVLRGGEFTVTFVRQDGDMVPVDPEHDEVVLTISTFSLARSQIAQLEITGQIGTLELR